MTSLFDLHRKYDSVKTRDKHPYSWEYITSIYPSYFEPHRETTQRILEIGAFKGGALSAMRDYFPNAHLYGIDKVNNIPEDFDYSRITIDFGNQSDKEFLTQIATQYGPFDFIIDDAGHKLEEQIVSLETLFPYVKTKGIYFIEDVGPRKKRLLIKKYVQDNPKYKATIYNTLIAIEKE